MSLFSYSERPNIISIDCETVSLKDRTLVGIAIATSPNDATYYPIDGPPFPPYVGSSATTHVMHNSLFDLGTLWDYNIKPVKIEDTIVMARLLNLPSKLTELYFWTDNKQTRDIKTVMKEHKVKKVSDLPLEVVAQKCCEDAMATFSLYLNLKGQLDAEYYKKEMELIPILLRMSKRGILLDSQAVSVLLQKYKRDVQFFRDYFEDEYGANIGSNQQVGYILATRGNVLPLTPSGKQLSVAERTLRKLDDPLVGMVLTFRASNKLLTTYLRPYSQAERAYAEFYPDTITGRLSSKNRNLQNIPPDIRHIFLPDGGLWADLDYSQIEMRLLAHLSGDTTLRDIYEREGDVHQATADFLHILRRRSKNVNFAIIYGATVATVAETAEVDVAEAGELLRGFFLAYPQAGAWIRATQEEGLRAGYITTMGGRKIKLPSEWSEESVRRKAVNYKIQGSAAEVLKEAMRRCGDMDIAASVHDELLGEMDIKELRSLELDRIFPGVYTPIEFRAGPNWRDLSVLPGC